MPETGGAENTLSYDLPRNVEFTEEGLVIWGKREQQGSRSWTTGDARGFGHPIPNYAKVVATGTTPFNAGLWPALMWLRPLDSADGEIDLIEVFGNQEDRFTSTIHSEYGPTHKQLQGGTKLSALANPDPTAEHTYVMEKTPDRIVISVDGVVMLNAGPDDVPAGFDWDRIFERPGAQWYPR